MHNHYYFKDQEDLTDVCLVLSKTFKCCHHSQKELLSQVWLRNKQNLSLMDLTDIEVINRVGLYLGWKGLAA